MLASVLNSKRAIDVNVFVVRVFVKLREMLATHKDLMIKISELERKIAGHDEEIRYLFQAIREMIRPPQSEPPRRKIGFLAE